MPPVKGETDEQRAAKSFKKASALIRRGKQRRVIGALKKHPDCLDGVEEHLISLGFLSPAKESNRSKQEQADRSPPSTAKVKSDPWAEPSDAAILVEGMAAPVSSCPTQDDDVQSPERKVDQPGVCPWDKNRTKIEKLGPEFLEENLTEAFPHIFTESNKKPLKKRNSKVMPHHRIYQFVEFVSNYEKTTNIPPELRNDAGFKDHFQTLCRDLGNRADKLILIKEEKDQWLLIGIYTIVEEKKNKLFIKHNFLKVTKTVAAPTGANKNYYLDHNFSEKSGCVRCHESDFEQPCQLLFAAEIAARDKSLAKTRAKRNNIKNEVKVEPNDVRSGGASHVEVNLDATLEEAIVEEEEEKPSATPKASQVTYTPKRRKVSG